MKKLFLLLVLAAIAVAVFFVFRNKPQVQRFEKTTHSAIGQTWQEVTNAAKEGTQKANELRTNVSTGVKAGMKRATKAATNAVAQVKEVTTNAFHQVRKAIGDTNR